MPSCCVEGCNSSRYHKNNPKSFKGKFISLPSDATKWKRWCDLLEITTKSRQFICGLHFSQDSWRKQDVMLNLPLDQRKLLPDAEPLPKGTINKHYFRTGRDYTTKLDPMNEETRKRLVADALAEYQESNIPKKLGIDKPGRLKLYDSCSAGKFSDTDEALELLTDIQNASEAEETLTEKIAKYKPKGKNKYTRSNIAVAKTDDNTTDMQEKALAELEIPLEKLRYQRVEKFGEIFIDSSDYSLYLSCLNCDQKYNESKEFLQHVTVAHHELLALVPGIFADNDSKPFNTVRSKVNTSNNVITAALSKNIVDDECEEGSDSGENWQEAINYIEIADPNTETRVKNTSIKKKLKGIDLIGNVPFVEATIDHLKLNRLLWPKYENVATKDFKENRKNVFANAVIELKKSYPELNLHQTNLYSLIRRLVAGYKADMQRKKAATMSDGTTEQYSPTHWFTERLYFLGNAWKPTDDELYRKALEHTANEVPIDLSTAEQELYYMDIIEMYERETGLWNITDPNYTGPLANEIQLRRLFMEITTAKFSDPSGTATLTGGINTNHIKTQTALRELLKKLNDWYSAVLQLKLLASTTSSSIDKANANEENYKEEGEDLNSNTNTYTCTVPRLFITLNFLNGHVSPYRCHKCNEQFYAYEDYVLHTSPQGRSKCKRSPKFGEFICEICQLRLACYASLKQHQSRHTGERPFICKYKDCGKRFRLSASLLKHHRTHSQVRPYKCDQCQRAFYAPYSLRIHKKLHADLREYMCHICGKEFKLKKYLQSHYRRHEKTNPHCKLCYRKFPSWLRAEKHQKLCDGQRIKRKEEILGRRQTEKHQKLCDGQQINRKEEILERRQSQQNTEQIMDVDEYIKEEIIIEEYIEEMPNTEEQYENDNYSYDSNYEFISEDGNEIDTIANIERCYDSMIEEND